MILLTAFDAFGPKGAVTGINASAVVLDRVMVLRPGRFHPAVLAAGDEGLTAYRALLQDGSWTGLLAMGETGGIRSDHVVLEQFASVVNNPGLLPPMPWNGTEQSLFAAQATAPRKGDVRSAGAFWCNRIYLEAMSWARGHGNRPVAFVHIPAVIGKSLPLYGRRVHGLYDHYAQEVLAILEQMESKANPEA